MLDVPGTPCLEHAPRDVRLKPERKVKQRCGCAVAVAAEPKPGELGWRGRLHWGTRRRVAPVAHALRPDPILNEARAKAVEVHHGSAENRGRALPRPGPGSEFGIRCARPVAARTQPPSLEARASRAHSPPFARGGPLDRLRHRPNRSRRHAPESREHFAVPPRSVLGVRSHRAQRGADVIDGLAAAHGEGCGHGPAGEVGHALLVSDRIQARELPNDCAPRLWPVSIGGQGAGNVLPHAMASLLGSSPLPLVTMQRLLSLRDFHGVVDQKIHAPARLHLGVSHDPRDRVPNHRIDGMSRADLRLDVRDGIAVVTHTGWTSLKDVTRHRPREGRHAVESERVTRVPLRRKRRGQGRRRGRRGPLRTRAAGSRKQIVDAIVKGRVLLERLDVEVVLGGRSGERPPRPLGPRGAPLVSPRYAAHAPRGGVRQHVLALAEEPSPNCWRLAVNANHPAVRRTLGRRPARRRRARSHRSRRRPRHPRRARRRRNASQRFGFGIVVAFLRPRARPAARVPRARQRIQVRSAFPSLSLPPRARLGDAGLEHAVDWWVDALNGLGRLASTAVVLAVDGVIAHRAQPRTPRPTHDPTTGGRRARRALATRAGRHRAHGIRHLRFCPLRQFVPLSQV